MANKIGIPLEGFRIRLVRTSNLDEVIVNFERHVEDLLKERFGDSIRVKAHVLEDGDGVTLVPILVAGATQ